MTSFETLSKTLSLLIPELSNLKNREHVSERKKTPKKKVGKNVMLIKSKKNTAKENLKTHPPKPLTLTNQFKEMKLIIKSLAITKTKQQQTRPTSSKINRDTDKNTENRTTNQSIETS